MALFPSKEFFEELRAHANANPDLFRRLGTVDLTLVVKIDYDDSSTCFEIAFSAYRCTGIRHLASVADAAKGAIVVSGPYSGWREMIDNIVANGHADLRHTLNTLTLLDTPLRIDAENQLDADLFYRYQQNLQEFFDGAGRIEAGAELAAAH
ncbi:MAG TPA: hypothetical protein VNF29_04845 [Candidatus Binataceae bacterium]|nr:hypothetical protein [Candidatus Binataceae bacterium]